MSDQEWIALAIVSIAAGVALRHGYRKYAAGPLARFFLKRGKVGLAMKIRGGKAGAKDRGGDCSCD